jgi:hypothetical protein
LPQNLSYYQRNSKDFRSAHQHVGWKFCRFNNGFFKAANNNDLAMIPSDFASHIGGGQRFQLTVSILECFLSLSAICFSLLHTYANYTITLAICQFFDFISCVNGG